MNAEQAAFVERITRDATHDMLNGLASIREAAGLMDDLLSLGLVKGQRKTFLGIGRKQDDHTERFKRSLTKTHNGVTRAADMCQALNLFGHCITSQEEPYRLRPRLEALALLLRRSVRSCRCELATGRLDPDLHATVPPLDLLHTITGCVDMLLPELQPEAVLTLSAVQEGGAAVIGIAGAAGMPRAAPQPHHPDIAPQPTKNGYTITLTKS